MITALGVKTHAFRDDSGTFPGYIRPCRYDGQARFFKGLCPLHRTISSAVFWMQPTFLHGERGRAGQGASFFALPFWAYRAVRLFCNLTI